MGHKPIPGGTYDFHKDIWGRPNWEREKNYLWRAHGIIGISHSDYKQSIQSMYHVFTWKIILLERNMNLVQPYK